MTKTSISLWMRAFALATHRERRDVGADRMGLRRGRCDAPVRVPAVWAAAAAQETRTRCYVGGAGATVTPKCSQCHRSPSPRGGPFSTVRLKPNLLAFATSHL